MTELTFAPFFPPLFHEARSSPFTRKMSGVRVGGTGLWSQQQNQSLYLGTASERMKGCEGMQLFKQLFDLVVMLPSVTHCGSNTEEITSTFNPLLQQFSAHCLTPHTVGEGVGVGGWGVMRKYCVHVGSVCCKCFYICKKRRKKRKRKVLKISHLEKKDRQI